MHIDILPDELLLMIFSQVPLKNLLEIKRTSKRWDRVIDLRDANHLLSYLNQLEKTTITPSMLEVLSELVPVFLYKVKTKTGASEKTETLQKIQSSNEDDRIEFIQRVITLCKSHRPDSNVVEENSSNGPISAPHEVSAQNNLIPTATTEKILTKKEIKKNKALLQEKINSQLLNYPHFQRYLTEILDLYIKCLPSFINDKIQDDSLLILKLTFLVHIKHVLMGEPYQHALDQGMLAPKSLASAKKVAIEYKQSAGRARDLDYWLKLIALALGSGSLSMFGCMALFFIYRLISGENTEILQEDLRGIYGAGLAELVALALFAMIHFYREHYLNLSNKTQATSQNITTNFFSRINQNNAEKTLANSDAREEKTPLIPKQNNDTTQVLNLNTGPEEEIALTSKKSKRGPSKFFPLALAKKTYDLSDEEKAIKMSERTSLVTPSKNQTNYHTVIETQSENAKGPSNVLEP